jgi:hypothetical protein
MYVAVDILSYVKIVNITMEKKKIKIIISLKVNKIGILKQKETRQ